jgi:Fur family ferric uptake transcriptional regulator
VSDQGPEPRSIREARKNVSSKAPHAEVAARLGRAQQRYTAGRRTLVELLHAAGRPLEIVELADGPKRLPVSSIYRNLVVLEQAGAVTRYPGAGGGHARYELSEALVGHHHHLVCSRCGRIEDDPVPPEVDAGLESLLGAVAARTGFTVTDHRLELRGLCERCAKTRL